MVNTRYDFRILRKVWKKVDSLVACAYLLLSIIAFRFILLSDKAPGHSGDWVIPATNLLLKEYFRMNNYIWMDQFLGYFRSWYVYGFPYNFILTTPSVFGISGSMVAKFWIVFAAMASSYTFYLATKNIIGSIFRNIDEKIQTFSAYIGGWFYGLGLLRYGLTIGGTFFALNSGLIFAPLMILYFIKYCLVRSCRYLLLFLIFSFLTLIGWPQLYLSLLLLLILVSVVGAFYKVFEFDRRFVLDFAVYITLLGMLSLYFLLPTLLRLEQVIYTAQTQSPLESLLQHYRLGKFYSYSLAHVFTGAEYTHIASLPRVQPSIYPIWIFVTISFIAMFAFFMPVLRSTNKRLYPTILFSSLIASLIYINLSMGPYRSPLRFLHIALYKVKILEPFWLLYRSLEDWFFPLTLTYSILITFGIYNLLHFLKERKNSKMVSVFALIILLMMVVIDLPFFSGMYLKESLNINKDARGVDLYTPNPDITNFYNAIYNDREEYRILFIPPERLVMFLETDFQNGNRFGEDPLVLFSPKQNIETVRSYSPSVDALKKKLKYELYNGYPESVDLLKFLGVKYIIIRKDVGSGYRPLYIDNFEKFLTENNATLLAKYRWISIYGLKGHLPKFYLIYEVYHCYRPLDLIPIAPYWNIGIVNDTNLTPIEEKLPLVFELNETTVNTMVIFPQYIRKEINYLYENKSLIIYISPSAGVKLGNRTWLQLSSPIIPIRSNNDRYIFKTIVKSYNTKALYIKILFFDKNNHVVKVGIPPKDAYYYGKARFGRKLDNASTYIFGVIIPPKGANYFRIQYWFKPNGFGQLLVRDLEIFHFRLASDFENNHNSAKVNYTKINPTLWKVKVNATKPFMLSFAEAYDPLWEARVYRDGKLMEKVRSIPLYSVINGFWINETGNLEIVIRYTPQDWFEIGLAISATTFVGCIGYLFYNWRRERGDKWAERVENSVSA